MARALDANEIHLILFDFGNVLEGPIDPQYYDQMLADLATRYGLRDGQAVWEHLYVSADWEQAKRGIISEEQFWANRLSELDIKDQNEQAEFEHLIKDNRAVYPEMNQLVKRLAQRYRLGIVSNSYLPNLHVYLTETCGFDELFDPVVSSAQVGLVKPERSIFELALEQAGCRAAETIFVDDLDRNIQAAKQLGIHGIQFESPQRLITHFEEQGIV